MKRLLGIVSFICLFLGFQIPARGIGLLIVEDGSSTTISATELPGSFPRTRFSRPIHRFTHLENRAVRVTAAIKDQVAHTVIQQEFYNPNARQLEGTFILPLPKGAHLSKFAMEINGKLVEAELLSAKKAKDIYETIVRKAKDPALLEYIGRDLIKVRIFPIEANSTKKIELSYDQLLKSDSGMVEFSLPLNTAQYSASAIETISLKVNLESSTDLKAIYSPSHPIEILRHTSKTAVIGFEERKSNPDKDFQLFFSAQQKEMGLNFLTYKGRGEDGYFMMLATPGFDNPNQEIIAKDVVFVIDTSGSMAGKKMNQAKKALTFCINSLNSDDRFEIIRFSTETESLFRKLTHVTEGSRHEAESFVENLKTIGGTAINDALHKALEARPKESIRPFMVVFLTDGLPTVGDKSEEGILRTVMKEDREMSRIFCFGIGTDVNTRLLDRVAEETRAVSQYVLPDEDLEVKVSNFFSKVSDPVLTSVDLDFGKFRTSSIYPAKLPDLFKGQQFIVMGRYSEGGSATARITGRVGERSEDFSYNVRFPEDSTEHSFIPRIWATRRVGYLLQELRLRGESKELEEEVTELGRKYGIVTPYTSFLVQEDQPLPALSSSSGRPETLSRKSAESRQLSSLGLQSPTVDRQDLFSARARSSGDAAVAGARYSGSLKTADTEQQVRLARREIEAFAFTGKLLASTPENASSQSTTKVANGKTFQMEDGVWVEAGVESKNTKLERIPFNSAEYWEFAGKHRELGEVLALGTKVKFVMNGKLYEIY